MKKQNQNILQWQQLRKHGVNVFYKDKGGTRGTVSDINGYYELKVTDGDAVLTLSLIHILYG